MLYSCVVGLGSLLLYIFISTIIINPIIHRVIYKMARCKYDVTKSSILLAKVKAIKWLTPTTSPSGRSSWGETRPEGNFSPDWRGVVAKPKRFFISLKAARHIALVSLQLYYLRRNSIVCRSPISPACRIYVTNKINSQYLLCHWLIKFNE